MSLASNHELARIFNEMAGIYRFGSERNRFRAIAYEHAARAIESLEDDILAHLDTLEEIEGIGESIAEKIREYASIGKIKKYESMKHRVPHDLLELLSVKGFGPESLKKMHRSLKVSTKEEVLNALQDGRVGRLKGFGPKKVENMLKGLQFHEQSVKRLLLWDGLRLGEELLLQVKSFPGVKEASLAGSVRRKRETIGDIDILISAEAQDHAGIVKRFASLNNVEKVLAKGSTKASIIVKDQHRQVDLRIIDPSEWGAALQYFTGSKDHNVHLREVARKRKLKVSEYGVFKGDKRIAGKTEEEVYKVLGFDYIPPEMREDRGELALAANGKLPVLIECDDIRGDLHMHSAWSDGAEAIENMADFTRKKYRYDYIVITDHSRSQRIAGGMDEKEFAKQLKEIDQLNKKLGRKYVKAGAEVDILPNGDLDLDDELLSRLDWVTASIHAGFNRDNTDRIIGACENPFVNAIGHPTGRLLGKREAYPLNMEKVLNAALRTGTALEINSQPDRMDLNEIWVAKARQAGVKLVISSDSHRLPEFAFIRLGVYIARRAWCTASDILNTQGWAAIEKFVNKKRSMYRVAGA